jgi:superfamily II DNA or RNA helicase
MNLRRHQAETVRIADRIAAGEDIREIFESVTPGGGKSALPGILADRLMPEIADRLLWVVPRNTLREQGESDFPEWSHYRIRAAGNEADPCRGTQGYVTTYQAIVADPARHLDTFSRGRWILFLDEPHHRLAGGPWDTSIAPLVERSSLVVYASGTFARGDGQPIAGLEYDGEGLPVFEGPGRACVRYSRTDALREGAIVPVHFRHLDGQAQWEDTEGAVHSAESLAGGDYASDALFTALRTGYALELLDETVADWLEYRRIVYPAGKLLVVAPNIDVARTYLEHLRKRGLDALLATSDDSPAAAEAIARFKGRALPTADILVTVAMAYEGMSVPAVSHIACLTHIRSVPWLEQCFARGNRTAPGKREAFIFAPADARIRDAIAAIEAEQVLALAPAPEGQEGGSEEGSEGGGGGGRERIKPIGSAAYREGPSLFDAPPPAPAPTPRRRPRAEGGLGPKAAEKLLRKQIADHIGIVIGRKRPGSKGPFEKILMRKLKELVGGKGRAECSTDELARQWAWLKENYPV